MFSFGGSSLPRLNLPRLSLRLLPTFRARRLLQYVSIFESLGTVWSRRRTLAALSRELFGGAALSTMLLSVGLSLPTHFAFSPIASPKGAIAQRKRWSRGVDTLAYQASNRVQGRRATDRRPAGHVQATSLASPWSRARRARIRFLTYSGLLLSGGLARHLGRMCNLNQLREATCRSLTLQRSDLGGLSIRSAHLARSLLRLGPGRSALIGSSARLLRIFGRFRYLHVTIQACAS